MMLSHEVHSNAQGAPPLRARVPSAVVDLEERRHGVEATLPSLGETSSATEPLAAIEKLNR